MALKLDARISPMLRALGSRMALKLHARISPMLRALLWREDLRVAVVVEVTVVEDATAGAKTPAGDAHAAAVVNYRYLANAVVTTKQAVDGLRKAFSQAARG